MINSVDIVRPFVEVVGQEQLPDVQIIGGIGSAALSRPGTIIVPNERLVVAPSDLQVPQYRDDGNKRDLDILVMSTDSEEIARVEEIAAYTIGDALVISVFGLHRVAEIDRQTAHPFSRGALGAALADRYVAERDGIIAEARKAVFPFSAPMDISTLETWRLDIGKGVYAPTPHPGTALLNYLTRSLSGLRPKDHRKVDEMAYHLLRNHNGLEEWLLEGPGASQFELARVLHTIREPVKDPQRLILGERLHVAPYKLSALKEHPAFLLRDKSAATQWLALEVAYDKARLLHVFEGNEAIVSFWQRVIEHRIGAILKNQ